MLELLFHVQVVALMEAYLEEIDLVRIVFLVGRQVTCVSESVRTRELVTFFEAAASVLPYYFSFLFHTPVVFSQTFLLPCQFGSRLEFELFAFVPSPAFLTVHFAFFALVKHYAEFLSLSLVTLCEPA